MVTVCIEANESTVGFAVFITYQIMLASQALRLGILWNPYSSGILLCYLSY
jgi:hypothetical protein